MKERIKITQLIRDPLSIIMSSNGSNESLVATSVSNAARNFKVLYFSFELTDAFCKMLDYFCPSITAEIGPKSLKEMEIIIQKEKPDLIYVDHVELIKDYMSPFDKLPFLSSMAKKNHVRIIALMEKPENKGQDFLYYLSSITNTVIVV